MDIWTWIERKALRAIIAAFATIIVLQFAFFNGAMDIFTSLLILVLLVVVSQIRAIQAWFERKN